MLFKLKCFSRQLGTQLCCPVKDLCIFHISDRMWLYFDRAFPVMSYPTYATFISIQNTLALIKTSLNVVLAKKKPKETRSEQTYVMVVSNNEFNVI